MSLDVKVKLAIWDQNNGASGANLTVRVKYVGVFTVTSSTLERDPATHRSIEGFFNTMASSGAFSPNPGPVTGSIALVQ